MFFWSNEVQWDKTEEEGLPPPKKKSPAGHLVTHIIPASSVIMWRKGVKKYGPGENSIVKGLSKL